MVYPRAPLSNRSESTVNGRNKVAYDIPVIQDEMARIFFELPRKSGSLNDPYLSIRGQEGFAGCLFCDSGEYYEETFFGIEGPDEAEELKSSETSEYELGPFLHREEFPTYGLREFNIPVDDKRRLEITADVTEDREEESLNLEAYEEEEVVSRLLIGRRDEGWTYLSNEDTSELRI